MTDVKGPDFVELVREIKAPPERVFRALTDGDELVLWWTGKMGLKRVESDLRAGGRYRWEFSDRDQTAVVHGEYRVVDPPHKLVMTWFSPKWPDMETVLSFELAPTATGTRLKLRHTGLTAPGACDDHERGWLEALALLIPWLATVGPFLAARRGGGATAE